MVKKTIAPFQKLKNRIAIEFPKKKLIGDIHINDEEFDVLMEILRNKYSALIKSGIQNMQDPMIAVALVQIGIRYYNGNYWGHVARILKIKLNPNNQQMLGEVFVNILKQYQKYMLDERERVNSILAHCFVSDHYATGLFEFMFDYYSIDLERDLNRNTSDAMNGMIAAIKQSAVATEINLTNKERKQSSAARVYMLRKHTVHAITAYPIPSRMKLRRILRLMDKCFWEYTKPAHPVSRLTIRFNEWHEGSDSFKKDYSRFYGDTTHIGGRKSYSTPYLKSDLRKTKFFIVIPTQLLKESDSHHLSWEIQTSTRRFAITGSVNQAVTGYKTIQKEISLSHEELFGEITIELKSENRTLRKFPKIGSDAVRFFDKDGDSSKTVIRGEMYAFTSRNETLISAALIDNEPIGELVRSYFDFQDGDIVVLPGGKSIAVGERYQEGLMRRNIVQDAYAIQQEDKVCIYNAPPTILLSLPSAKLNGTSIEINGTRHKMFDQQVTVFDTFDGSGNSGVLIQMEEWGCAYDGIYQIVIDVPNERKARNWTFGLINGMKADFEDAPYLFEQRGTINFSENTVAKPFLRDEVQPIAGDNAFNFLISAEHDDIGFEFVIATEPIIVYFPVPVLKWKYSSHTWQVLAPPDLWHTQFPGRIYFKFPGNKLTLSMDESLDIDKESDNGNRMVVYEKTLSSGLFECDLTRFRSWFDRSRTVQWIYVSIGPKRIPLMRVFTISEIVSHLIAADFKRNWLVVELDIIGQSNYYVDIVHIPSGTIIADKRQINNGRLEFYADLKSGLYRLDVFEAELDDSGFGESVMYPLKSIQQNLVDPHDLSGKKLNIRHIKNPPDSSFLMSLLGDYKVSDLKKIDINSYEGKLSIHRLNGKKEEIFKVRIEFPNLDRIKIVHLTFWDNEEQTWLDFLYDSKLKTIVKHEEQGLRSGERYRRYSVLYLEDCVFNVDIT